MKLDHVSKWVWIGLAALLVAGLAAGVAWAWQVRARRSEALYIAVMAPLSGPNQTDGQDTVRGVRLCLNQINQQGGVNGRPVELLVYDDANKPDVAKAQALEMAQQTQVMAVLGHSLSSASIQAGQVYKEYGIPALTGSATADRVTAGNEWYFRLIPNSRSQSTFLANYVVQVFQQRRAVIVYDTDDYGKTLAAPFESAFRELGGEIVGVWSLDTAEPDVDGRLDEMADQIGQKNPQVVFMALHAVEGAKLIAAMRYRGLTYPVIGASAFANLDFVTSFDRFEEENSSPGYFSDGVYATAPVIFDVSGDQAQQFRTEYLRQYGVAPGMKAATNCDAARIVVQAMRDLNVQGRPEGLAQERQRVRDYLAGLDRIDKAMWGVTGPVYFDAERNIARPAAMGVYQKRNLISAMTQFQPVVDVRRIFNLEQALADGKVIVVDSQYMYKTRVIYAGLDVNTISNLDTGKSTYTVDFYLWFRYRGEFPDADIEFINATSKLKLDAPIAESVDSNGLTYRVYRVKAAFVGDFDFHNYPFDSQELGVRFRHRTLTKENLIYVVDLMGMPRLAKGIWTEHLRAHAFTSTEGWSINESNVFQDTLTQSSTLGNPNMFGAEPYIAFSRFNAEIVVKRDALSYIIKNLFPVLILIVVSYLVLFMPAKVLPPRVSVSVTVILTTAFFSARLSSDLPSRVGYLSALEYVFFVVYVLCLYGLLVSSLDFRYEGQAWMNRLNLISRIAYPIVVLLTFAIIAWVYI